MKSMLVINKTDTIMTLMLEPIGEYFAIPPGTKVSIVGKFSDEQRDYGEIAQHRDNCIAVWTSLDATVCKMGSHWHPTDSIRRSSPRKIDQTVMAHFTWAIQSHMRRCL